MKSTGMTRRIDDLGRIVIPKELRRNMDIAEGDQLEIHVDGDMICLRKYDTAQNIDMLLRKLKTAISDDYNLDCWEDVLMEIDRIEKMLHREDKQ